MLHWALQGPAPSPAPWSFDFPERLGTTGGCFPVAEKAPWWDFMQRAPREMRLEEMERQALALRDRSRLKLRSYLRTFVRWSLRLWDRRPFRTALLDGRSLSERSDLPWTMRPGPDGRARGLTDEEFAYQRLNGLNPHMIARVTLGGVRSLMEKVAFPAAALSPAGSAAACAAGVIAVTGEPDATLHTLAAAGRLFVCDYELLLECTKRAGTAPYATAPIVLLYLKGDVLLPLAIQLRPLRPSAQRPAAHEYPALLPDHDNDGNDTAPWLAAKLQAQSADALTHEGVVHLTGCHLASEAMYLALLRSVGEQHPLRGFLRPHMWYTTVINIAAREELVCRKLRGARVEAKIFRFIGLFSPRLAYGLTVRLCPLTYDQLADTLVTLHTNYDFSRYNVPASLKARGIHPDDEAGANSLAPSFFWRSDALRIWTAIGAYTDAFVAAVFSDDESVRSDTQLQRWVATLRGNLAGMEGCGFTNVPGTSGPDGIEISARSELSLLLQCVVYNASAGHAATNNSLFEFCMDAAAMPRTLRVSPDRIAAREVTHPEIQQGMPGWFDCVTAAALADTLSWTPEHGLPYRLGDVAADDEFFGERCPGASAAAALRQGLAEASAAIDRRNAALGDPHDCADSSRRPYLFLHPNQIAAGTSV